MEYGLILLWLFLIEVLSFVTLPISTFLFYKLHDKGYGASKLFSIILITYLSYIIARFQLLPFNFYTILISFSLVFLLSAFILIRHRLFQIFISKEFKDIAFKCEVVFLASFFLFIFIRSYFPDIKGGETFYDLAYLNSIIRTDKLPPMHTWFSQVSLENYYYFGHLMIGVLSKFSGISGIFSYNLSLATIMALTCLLTFSLSYNLTKKSFCAIIAVFLISFTGNFFSFLQVLNYFFPDFNVYVKFYEPPVYGDFFQKARDYNWWHPSRIIPWAIHEMPYWTFVWGDLHGHFFAIPLRILLLIFLLKIFASEFSGFKIFGENFFEKILNIFSLCLILGFIFPTNIYDFPFLAFWVLLTFIFHELNIPEGRRLSMVLQAFLISFLIVIFSLLLYAPVVFQLLQHIQDVRVREFIELLPHEKNPLLNSGTANSIRIEVFKTSLYHFLLIFSLQVFLIFTFILHLFYTSFAKESKLMKVLFSISLFLYLSLVFSVFMSFFPRIEQFYNPINVLLSINSLLYDFQLLSILIPIVSSSIFFLLRENSVEVKFILLLILFGALTALITEVINVEGRYVFMNKIYGEIYIFWGISSAFILSYFGKKILSLKYLAILFIVCFLFFSYAIFPILTTIQRTNSFKASYGREFLTLNGADWLEREHKADFEAIKWLNENIKGSPIVLEVPGRDYQYTSRVSVFTGLPTVLGWSDHMELHLAISRENIEKISKEVDEIYNTTDNERALNLIRKYNVSYIYIGELEKNYEGVFIHGDKIEKKEYSEEGLEKFDKFPEFYEKIYDNEDVQIYRVISSS
ncbi:MAG: DUF2298 domain-containing protein [Candidatus Altiarchaeota archaeon]